MVTLSRDKLQGILDRSFNDSFRGIGTWTRPYEKFLLIIGRKPDSITIDVTPREGTQLPITPKPRGVPNTSRYSRMEVSTDRGFLGRAYFHWDEDNQKFFVHWRNLLDEDTWVKLHAIV